MSFTSLFKDFNKKIKENNTVHIFNILKTKTIEKYEEIYPVNQTGRPRVDLDGVLDCLFGVTEDAIKLRNTKKYYNISKTTFIRYRDNIHKANIFNIINDEMLDEKNIKNNKKVIVDCEIIKSIDGSEGVGSNCTDRGRNGIKESIIIDYESKAIIESYVDKANVHDSKILQKMDYFNKQHKKLKVLYADSAYIGKQLRVNSRSNNIRLVSVPKKLRNKKLSHYLQTTDRKNLKQRWGIERIISIYRQFRGISIKRTKKINAFRCMFSLVSMCITCLSLFVH